MSQYIDLHGVRVNNLKNISLQLQRGEFIAVTGVSGSGKSSLAFDTLYAEGQRRYVESLSSYARQFLGRLDKPECDYIKGLPPAIAIEQKVSARNPRSTVGTTTEIYEYMRLLFARIGHTYSPVSGQEVRKHSPDDVVRQVQLFSPGTPFLILAPITVPADRTLRQQLNTYVLQGYSRIMAGQVVRIDDYLNTLQATPDERADTELFLVIDRLSASDDKDTLSRLTDSTETAFFEGHGQCRLSVLPAGLNYDFSTRFEADGISFDEPTDQLFSFNSPAGACTECQGFGNIMGIDEHLVIPDTALSVYDGCVQCWHGDKMKIWQQEFCRQAASYDFPIFEPYYSLTPEQKDMLWHGFTYRQGRASSAGTSAQPLEWDEGVEPCIDNFFQMLRDNQYKIQYRVMLSRYRGRTVCPRCRGTRLKPEATYVKIGGRSICDLVEMPVARLAEWLRQLPSQLTPQEQQIAQRLLAEINSRIGFLLDVGLGYLTLGRRSNSLSGGESQRISLCTSLGSSLVGSLYILDEPSIGLHSRDTQRLIGVMRKLQQAGNTVVVVEHDEEIMRAADLLVDVGPDAGRLGGEIVYQGPTADITPQTAARFPRSHTLRYLTHQELLPLPDGRRQWNRSIRVVGARMNNLKGISVDIPLNVMTVVTGVSGSGKSSLIKGVFFPALKRRLGEAYDAPGDHKRLEGDIAAISHVEFVDQNPIGKSSRSNPATYIKAYDAIRELMADQPLAKQMGFTPQHFSFNTDGGRCDECKGAGVITVEMQFMADLVLTCESCHGHRFKQDILDVRYDGRNIDDILNMTIDEALLFFGSHSADSKAATICRRMQPLADVGLGYIKLGQSSSTLSGGENQRVKLAYYISMERQEPTLFIFDEPTTGLHFHDIRRLLEAMNALIRRGHTILVIEHNLDVIKMADHVIDLGPEGGDRGGTLVVAGTPEQVADCQQSLTGRYLRPKLNTM
ncbi:MAG: excinuclease ABC subunit UvrA [Prevotella sp.]|nr:excinuclease ABC subunit UvrA [Prevotella sp.]